MYPLLAIVAFLSAAQAISDQIVGPTPNWKIRTADLSEHPYVVSIYDRDNVFVQVGVILSPHLILTAVDHVLDSNGHLRPGLTVRAGSSRLYRQTWNTDYAVKYAHHYPDGCDRLAVLVLGTGIQYVDGRRMPIGLFHDEITPYDSGKILTWFSNNPRRDSVMKNNKMKVIDVGYDVDQHCTRSHLPVNYYNQKCPIHCVPNLSSGPSVPLGSPYIIRNQVAGFVTFSSVLRNEPIIIEPLSYEIKQALSELTTKDKRGDTKLGPAISAGSRNPWVVIPFEPNNKAPTNYIRIPGYSAYWPIKE